MSLKAWINGTLGVGAAAILTDAFFAHGLRAHAAKPGFLDDRAISNGILTAGALMWPVLFDALFGYETLAHKPAAAIGLAVPLLLTTLQLGSSKSFDDDAGSPDDQRRAEAQIVVSAALSVGILMLNRSRTSDTQEGLEAILMAVVLAVAVIIPSASLGQKKHGTKLVVQSGQRVALNYAIGLVVLGVLLAAFAKNAGTASSGTPTPFLPA